MGCIFAEILERKVLFQGKDHIDQLHKILGVLGLPRDISFWDPSESILAHIQNLCTTDGLPPPTDPVDFYALFPSCSHEGIVLLKAFLQLDPMKRPNVAEALKSPFIQIFSDPIEESLMPPSRLPNQYDFERINNDTDLKKAVLHEIESFKHQQQVAFQLVEQDLFTTPRRHNTTAADTQSYCTTPTQKLNQLPSATMSLLEEHSKPTSFLFNGEVKAPVYTQEGLVGEPEELGEDENYKYLCDLMNSTTPGIPIDSNRTFCEPKNGDARDTLERALTGTW